MQLKRRLTNMDKIRTLEEAMAFVKDGMTIMVGGFGGRGTPEVFIDTLVKNGVKDLTIIANDTGTPEIGNGKLVANKQVKKVIVSHIGLNPETGKQMNKGEVIVELVPQGTLVERIRCGGSGIGGFLTETGIGTLVEEDKQKISLKGKTYILETPLKADVALISAAVADRKGNLYYKGSMRNFNPIMAMAADLVIAGVERIVEPGELDPNDVMTPGIFVDIIVGGER
jgi:acetate CoA/acetoacetate CoA-transferase alpha subunit